MDFKNESLININNYIKNISNYKKCCNISEYIRYDLDNSFICKKCCNKIIIEEKKTCKKCNKNIDDNNYQYYDNNYNYCICFYNKYNFYVNQNDFIKKNFDKLCPVCNESINKHTDYINSCYNNRIGWRKCKRENLEIAKNFKFTDIYKVRDINDIVNKHYIKYNNISFLNNNKSKTCIIM